MRCGLTLAWALGFAVTLAATPLAIRVALATDLLDRPGGHKAHEAATPYLGGAAVLAGIAAAAVPLGDDRLLPIVGAAGALWAVGTLDDRFTVAPAYRLITAMAGGAVLWTSDLGWSVIGSEPVDLVLTLLWTAAVSIAFNLLDNIDGAAATTAAVAGAGTGVIAALNDDGLLGGLALGLSGACLAFLAFNLASPARVFLGDGGSLPLGFVLAAAAMALPLDTEVAGTSIFVAVLFAGVPILDTTFVVVSRTHRRVPLHQGGRDHLTHRLLARLGSARAWRSSSLRARPSSARWRSPSAGSRPQTSCSTLAPVRACPPPK